MVFDAFLSSASAALMTCQRIAAVGIALTSLEYIVRNKDLNDDGLMSWMVCRLRHRVFSHGRFAAFLDFMLRHPNVMYAYAVRMALGIALLVSRPGAVNCALLSVTTLLSLLLLSRQPYGSDGADQATNIVLLSLTVAALARTEMALTACAWFLAGQCCLSYLTAGLAKVSNPEWRSGRALVGILGTHMYGNPALARFLRGQPRRLARGMGMAVVAGECLLPLMLVAPKAWLPAFLIAGLMFHISTAVAMGLNSFLWAFPAMYPAIAYAVIVSRPW